MHQDYHLNHNIQIEILGKVPGILKIPFHPSFLCSLCVYLFIEFYSIKRFHLTETKICVKLESKAANTAYTWETHIEKKENTYN